MVRRLETTPKRDGYRMPAEFSPHKKTWLIWPERSDTWRLGAKPAQAAFAKVACAIAEFEPVTMCVGAKYFESVREALPAHIQVVELSTNDAWMRDIGPTFVVNDKGGVRGIDWGFNAWGGLHGGLYFPWDLDMQVKAKILELEQCDRYGARDFILEGGAITVDGEGTVLTTKQCLLHPNRNAQLSEKQIENKLKDYLSVEKVIWLERGMADDETDGHIDELAFFVRPGEVALSWTDDPLNPHYAIVREAFETLSQATDAQGRKLIVHKVPLPRPIRMTAEESKGLDLSITSFPREGGTLFVASYVNCYLCNGGVIIPGFDDPLDERAKHIFQNLYPDRRVVQVQTREIALGGGNIHCITQQQPL
ncbi:agmatine deiminase [Sporolactobacillus sp. THM7-7]|nr:agmatine deiminase [Sporolactobacillus sp. THM7-7]